MVVDHSARAGERKRSVGEERLDVLATALFCIAGLVLALSVIGAVTMVSTNVTLGSILPEDVERQSRGLAAIGALAAGFAAAGVLAGLGGILKALLR